MKRILALILTAVVAATVVSCGSELTPSQYADDTTAANVTMQTQYPVYAPDFERIQVTLTNNTGATLEFGAEWSLEIKQGDKWMTLPFAENVGWISLLYMVEDGGTHTFDVSRNMLDFEFVDGTYRVVKEFNGGAIGAAAQFEIGESKISAESPYGYAPLESLPYDYSMADAVSDGCVAYGDQNTDGELTRFASDVREGLNTQIRFCRETEAGLVITDILAERLYSDCRIKYTVDKSRAGGGVEASYYGGIGVIDGELVMKNTVSADEYAQIADTGIDFSAYSFDTAKQGGATANYWSKDGLRLITLYDGDKVFGYSQFFPEGGTSGSLCALPDFVPCDYIVSAEWLDEVNVKFTYKPTSREETQEYVYNTDNHN